MSTPAGNLNNTTHPVDDNSFGTDMRAILNRLALEIDNFGYEAKEEVKDYVMTSFLVLKFMFLVGTLFVLAYRFVADINTPSDTWLIPSNLAEVNVLWYLALFVQLLMAVCFGWAYGRLAMLGFIVAIIERAAIGLAQVLSFLLPNRIENLFGNAAAFQAALKQRAVEQAMWKEADKALKFYLNVMAWVLSVEFTLLIWPWAIGFIPTVIALIGIITAVAITYGWKTTPFWLEKIKSGLFHFVGITTFCYLVVRPIFRFLFGGSRDNAPSYLDGTLSFMFEHRAIIGAVFLGIVLLVVLVRKLGWGEKDAGELKGAAWLILAFIALLLILFINPILHYLHRHTPGRQAVIEQALKDSDNPGKSGYYELTERYKKEAVAAKQQESHPVEPPPTELSPVIKALLVENAAYTNVRTGKVYVYSGGQFHTVTDGRGFPEYRMMPANVPQSAIGEDYK
jgi:hypothetical protein